MQASLQSSRVKYNIQLIIKWTRLTVFFLALQQQLSTKSNFQLALTDGINFIAADITEMLLLWRLRHFRKISACLLHPITAKLKHVSELFLLLNHLTRYL